MAVSVNCPSCGVLIEDASAHTRSMSCPHCSNWVYFGSNGWESAGLFKHAIDAPSMLRLGKSGSLENRRFTVSGRVRLSYSDGFWDEWWLEFEDADNQWLEEDDGVYRLHENISVDTGQQQLKDAGVGSNISIAGDDWFVTERIDAQVAGVEGSLPVAIFPGEQVVCIDVMGKGTKMSIEASGQDVQVSRSSVVRGSKFAWEKA